MPHKKKRRPAVVQAHEARSLRRQENPDFDELRDYFMRREEYFARMKPGQVSDYIEFSPMAICRRWTEDGPYSN